jgi:hypothetical protein
VFDISDRDRWVYGAQAIGEIANIRNEDGEVDIPRILYALRMGHLDAEKFGRLWRSTPRRLLKGERYIPAPKKSDKDTTQEGRHGRRRY